MERARRAISGGSFAALRDDVERSARERVA
jgi:hypothetical protein